MIETWVLLVWMASGEVVMVPRETALVCDLERTAIERAALEAEHAGTCPMVLGAACTPVLVAPELREAR